MAETLRQKLQALEVLLRGYGPYKREQLRLKLLSKASLLRDEVLRAGIAAEKFARLGPRPAPAACAPVALEAEAAELEALALAVARWPAAVGG